MTIRGPYEYPKYYIGLSTDTKPIAEIGDKFYEINVLTNVIDKVYICSGGTNWYEKIDALASDITEINSDVKSIISDLVDITSDLNDIRSDIVTVQSDLGDVASDLIITQSDAQIRTISGGSKLIASGVTKYLSFDSGTNGAEIISIIVKGLIGAAWTLDVYVPTADAVAAPAAADKRDTIAYLSTDTEGGLLQGFGIIFNGFLNFTNNGVGDQTITDVVIVARSRAVLSVAWEA